MPKEFDSTKLVFSSGLYKTVNNENIEYNVEGKKIVGRYIRKLQPHNALTVRCELPKSYFTIKKDYTLIYIVASISATLFILSYLLYLKSVRKNGKDNEVVETVEFYPPNGINSLEAGFLYKGRANHKDVNFLLICLANKGYIKISSKDNKKRSKNFVITKVKDYNGTDKNEKMFFNGLFKSSDEVTFNDLYDKFYTTTNKIQRNVNSKENILKAFDKSSLIKSGLIVLIILISFCTSLIFSIFDYYSGFFNMEDFSPLFPSIGLGIIIYLYIVKKYKELAGVIFLTIATWIGFTLEFILKDSNYLISHIIGLISIIGMIIILKIIPKRTQYGNEMLGKLKGFKNFLKTAEKEKLELLVEQDPIYFYNILPYTYVLGVSDKWIKKFESISMQAPNWYDSPSAFDLLVFNNTINRTMNSLQSHYVSDSSYSGGSSGGGFTGGGFSGGGFGGSSGSSW